MQLIEVIFTKLALRFEAQIAIFALQCGRLSVRIALTEELVCRAARIYRLPEFEFLLDWARDRGQDTKTGGLCKLPTMHQAPWGWKGQRLAYL